MAIGTPRIVYPFESCTSVTGSASGEGSVQGLPKTPSTHRHNSRVTSNMMGNGEEHQTQSQSSEMPLRRSALMGVEVFEM